MHFILVIRLENETEDYVSIQIGRSTATPIQWAPDSGRMSNSQGIDIRYKNGSFYEIPETTPENEFEIWMDNKVLFRELNIMNGWTNFRAQSMATHIMYIPKAVSVFINVMHNVNWTEIIYNVTDKKGNIVGTAPKLSLLNPDHYFGMN